MAEVGTWDWLRGMLRGYGLEDLFDTAKGQVTQGASEAQVQEVLRNTEQYRTRFRAVFEREKAGLPPITPAMVLEHERQLGELFSFYGYQLNPGESIRDIAAQDLINDVSVNEKQSRLAAYRDVFDRIAGDPANETFVNQMLRMGGTPMDIARAVISPESTPLIESRLRAASIALEARRYGQGLTAQEAQRLADRGVTGDQAEEGFGELSRQAQVTGPIAGERRGMDRQAQLDAVAGDPRAQQELAARAAQRRAAFQGGGRFATDDEGFGGLG